MMMMMMSVVICDEIYRILFKNNFLPSPVFSSFVPFLVFLGFLLVLREGKKDLLLAKGEENLCIFTFFFPFLEAESDVNFTFFL